MKIRTMNRNNLKDPRHQDFNYNTIALPIFGFFNETTLSWQLKHLFSTTYCNDIEANNQTSSSTVRQF